MSQMVGLHVGDFGTKVGAEYWNLLESEAEVFAKQGGINRSSDFCEGLFGTYAPRAVLVGQHKGSFNDLNSSYPIDKFSFDGHLFSDSKLHFNERHHEVMNAIASQAETCDHLCGFNLSLGIDERFSTEFCKEILPLLVEEYSGKLILANAKFPDQRDNFEGCIADYHATISLLHLNKHSHMVSMFDFPAIFHKLKEEQEIKSPNFSNVNKMIAAFLAGITSTNRCPGALHASPRKMLTSLIAFDTMKLVVPAMSTLTPPTKEQYINKDNFHLISDCLNPKRTLCNVDPRHGRYTSIYSAFRGPIETGTIEKSTIDLQNKNSSYFVEWIPSNICVSHASTPGLVQGTKTPLTRPTAFSLSVTSAVQEYLNSLKDRVKLVFRRKGFFCQINDEGHSSDDISAAFRNLKEIHKAYNFITYGGLEEPEDYYRYQQGY